VPDTCLVTDTILTVIITLKYTISQIINRIRVSMLYRSRVRAW